MNNELIINHNAGFFSNCSVRLTKIVEFFNSYKRLPYSIDCKKQFHNYKVNPEDINEDLNPLYFDQNSNQTIEYINDVDFFWEHQFKLYNELEFSNLNKFVTKYFSPSNFINDLISQTERKYNIDYSKTIGVCYRGNDKSTETNIASYDNFFEECKLIQQKYNIARFLVQTDELEFRLQFMELFPNSFFIESIPLIKKNKHCVMHNLIDQKSKPLFGALILHAMLILSKCEYVITHSGNCGMWIALYRKNANNISQYLKHYNYNGWYRF